MGWKAAGKSRDDPAKREAKRAAKREAAARGSVSAPKERSMSGDQADHASSPRKRRHAREGAKKLGMQMAVTPIRNLRVDDERWAAWEASASAAGVSITKLVVATMDNAGHSRSSGSGGSVVLEPAQETVVVEGPVGDVPAAGTARTAARRSRRPRTTMCDHRNPPGTHCSRGCDG